MRYRRRELGTLPKAGLPYPPNGISAIFLTIRLRPQVGHYEIAKRNEILDEDALAPVALDFASRVLRSRPTVDTARHDNPCRHALPFAHVQLLAEYAFLEQITEQRRNRTPQNSTR